MSYFLSLFPTVRIQSDLDQSSERICKRPFIDIPVVLACFGRSEHNALHEPLTEAEIILSDGLQPCVLQVAVKSPFLPAKACRWAHNSTRMELEVGPSSVSIKVPDASDLLDNITLHPLLPRP
jgi:hypothetical protein